jgi:hypothetical protein
VELIVANVSLEPDRVVKAARCLVEECFGESVRYRNVAWAKIWNIAANALILYALSCIILHTTRSMGIMARELRI